MATIIRSSKYIRCLNRHARTIVVPRGNGYLPSKYLSTVQIKSINSYLAKSYATAPAIQRDQPNRNFDRHFTKLNENFQRYGRLFKADIEHVLSKIQAAGYVSSLDGLLLIRCCGEFLIDASPQHRNALVQEIWNTLETLNVPMDVSHFNALLRVHLENNNDLSPIEILTKMKERGIEPNRVTYQRLLLHHCKKGDIQGATKILQFMKEKDLSLTDSIFSALITGHSEANDMESANNILNVMKDAGVDPSSSTYTALMCAHAKRGEIDSINNIIANCGTKNLYLHDKELFQVIQVLAKNGHTNEIEKILSIMPRGPNYNFDALHAVLKVVDDGNADLGLKILLTMKTRRNFDERTEDTEDGAFYLRKMVNSKISIDKIIKACNTLEQQGHQPRALFIALERSLLNRDAELSLPLLKAYKDKGETIREHFLWPILAAYGKASNYQAIQDVIKFMITELKLIPGIESLTDYVLPYAVGQWDDIVSTLETHGIPRKTIVNAIAVRMIMDKKMRKTCMFMIKYPSEYDPRWFYRVLANGLKTTEDSQSFAIILRLFLENQSHTASQVRDNLDEIHSGDIDNPNLIDTAVRKALNIVTTPKYVIIDELLTRLIDMGIGLSPDMNEQLKRFFRDNITAETIEKIDKLTSGKLIPVPISDIQSSVSTGGDNEITGGAQETSAIPRVNSEFLNKKQQLTSYLLSRDVAGVEALTKELESMNMKFSTPLYAQIIDIFCTNENLDQAKKWMNKLTSEHPEDLLDIQKSTSYATLLVKNGRFDEALEFIKNSARKVKPIDQKIGLKRFSKKLLDTSAETGNVENTEKLFDALVSSNYTTISNLILGPLVKVHIVKGDLDGALKAFERICENYHCTPLKNELSKKFIDAEDATSLQRLTDLSTRIHGETNSLIDLVFAFIECGRLRQARKILETPGLILRSSKLRTLVPRYVKKNNHVYLDRLFELTKDLPGFYRQKLYDVLLEAYEENNDWQSGLSLWTKMQDEDTYPSQTFLDTLAAMLKSNNIPVPFIHSQVPSTPVKPTNDYAAELKEALEAGDFDKIEIICRNFPNNDKEYSKLLSDFIEEMLKRENNVIKAFEIAKILTSKLTVRQPFPKFLVTIWNRLIDAGEFEKFKEFDNLLSPAMKEKCRFFKWRSRAIVKEVGLEQFLDDFEARLSESPEDHFKLVQENFHYTTLIEEFYKHPSALNKFRQIAEKLFDQGTKLPINMMWDFYFEQNKPEADEIWSKYLSNQKNVEFGHVIKKSMENNNIEILERLYKTFASNTSLSTIVKVRLLAKMLEAYDKNGRYDDAIKLLESQSTSTISHLKKLRWMVLNRLKTNLLANGKSIPSNVQNIES